MDLFKQMISTMRQRTSLLSSCATRLVVRCWLLDMPKSCLPRLVSGQQVCKQDARRAQTWRKHVCPVRWDGPDCHCLVVSGIAGVQLLGCGGTKPQALEFALEFASKHFLDKSRNSVFVVVEVYY